MAVESYRCDGVYAVESKPGRFGVGAGAGAGTGAGAGAGGGGQLFAGVERLRERPVLASDPRLVPLVEAIVGVLDQSGGEQGLVHRPWHHRRDGGGDGRVGGAGNGPVGAVQLEPCGMGAAYEEAAEQRREQGKHRRTARPGSGSFTAAVVRVR